MNIAACHSERSAAISFWCIIAIGLALTGVSVASAKYSGGAGDPNDPYQIATAADLIALGETPDDYDKHFILTADIDLSDYDGKDGRPAFQVIGDCYTSSNGITTYVKGTLFAGIFDGNGKTIFHLTSLQANGNLLGLFGGLAQGAEVKNLRVLADIDMDAMDSVVGALAGYNGGTVTQCSSGGVVTGKGWMTVGGMVGLNMAGTITDCHSDALVSGGRGVGGLVGWNCHWQGDGVRLRGLVARCYSAGRVSGALYVGSLVGYNGGEMVGCFWDMQTSGQTTSPGETGKTTAEMQTAQTFLDAGWDFVGETANGTEDIWKIAEGTGYPRLSWEKYSGGTGEPNDPYQIATAADLIALGETPDDYDKHFILTADIDLDPNLPGGRVFDKAVIAPTAEETGPNTVFQGTAFSGVFDGNDRTISNLTIQGMNYLGLFGRLSGSVKNVCLEDVNISGSGCYAAGLMGYNAGTIVRCSSVGRVHGRGYVGGLIGYNAGIVIQCCGDAYVDGQTSIGGLVGFNYGNIVASSSAGTVCGEKWCAGGLAGDNTRTIIASYATGIVNGNTHVGGLAGENGGSIVAAYSTGAVTGVDRVGGLVGEVYGHIVASYSTGAVTGNTYVGGLVGSTRGGRHAYVSFWDVETSGQTTSLAGIGKTTAELQTLATFLDAGWDFVDETLHGTCDFWRMSSGEYPRLRYCVDEGPVMPEGLGTPEEPYLIRNARDLGTVWFQPAAHYRLAASVDLSGILWSTAVVPSFEGTFDGNGCAVSNLRIQGMAYLALFGSLDPWGKISNLGLEAVDANGISYVAGLTVENRGSIISSYSRGTIRGLACVGGLVAWNSGQIATSYSRGTVAGTDWAIGGLVGRNDGGITACYSATAVAGEDYVGGLVGYGRFGKVTASFWDADISGVDVIPWGAGRITAEMQTASTFLEAGWDFVDETANGIEDIWWIEEGQDYPRLWWEPRPAVRLPVIKLDATTFDAGIAEGVVLVDFFATWCSHCVTQAPILEEVADRLEGRAQVAKLDIDKARSVATRYGVTAVPTLILFRDGVEVQRFVGVTGVDVLVEAILAVAGSM